ncbi:MAG: hypothetical protein MUO26_12600 [Methanotrichaceae archaeon]|nr:hypothetical protein [Methanotrichaceae archaeon]
MIRTEANLPNGSYSRELSRLLSRSKLINKHFEDDFDISFSSLFLAFLVNDDIISKWFQDYVRKSKINVDTILKERKMTKQLMDRISTYQPLDTGRHNYRLTTSADTYLRIAENFRQGLLIENKSYPLAVHHLMAVFIYKPWVHEKDLIKWGLNLENWSNAFLEQIKTSFLEELNFWIEQHLRAFQKQAKF